jgi:hypothetical protein
MSSRSIMAAPRPSALEAAPGCGRPCRRAYGLSTAGRRISRSATAAANAPSSCARAAGALAPRAARLCAGAAHGGARRRAHMCVQAAAGRTKTRLKGLTCSTGNKDTRQVSNLGMSCITHDPALLLVVHLMCCASAPEVRRPRGCSCAAIVCRSVCLTAQGRRACSMYVTLPMLRAMVPDSVQRVSGSIGTPMSARPAFLRAGRRGPEVKLATPMSQAGHHWKGRALPAQQHRLHVQACRLIRNPAEKGAVSARLDGGSTGVAIDRARLMAFCCHTRVASAAANCRSMRACAHVLDEQERCAVHVTSTRHQAKRCKQAQATH